MVAQERFRIANQEAKLEFVSFLIRLLDGFKQCPMRTQHIVKEHDEQRIAPGSLGMMHCNTEIFANQPLEFSWLFRQLCKVVIAF